MKTMNTIMNLCVLILSIFLAVAMFGCGDGDTEQLSTSNYESVPSRVSLKGNRRVAADPVREDPVQEEVVEVAADPVREDPVQEEVVEVAADPVREDPVQEEVVEVAADPVREDPVQEEVVEVVRPVGGPLPQDEIDKLPANQQAAIAVFKKGSRVFVRNTGEQGLRIRFPAGGDQIGGMFDGETGTITAHPDISKKLAWFFIEWDRPVKDRRSGCGDREVCMGWSVAITPQRLKVLNLIK